MKPGAAGGSRCGDGCHASPSACEARAYRVRTPHRRYRWSRTLGRWARTKARIRAATATSQRRNVTGEGAGRSPIPIDEDNTAPFDLAWLTSSVSPSSMGKPSASCNLPNRWESGRPRRAATRQLPIFGRIGRPPVALARPKMSGSRSSARRPEPRAHGFIDVPVVRRLLYGNPEAHTADEPAPEPAVVEAPGNEKSPIQAVDRVCRPVTLRWAHPLLGQAARGSRGREAPPRRAFCGSSDCRRPSASRTLAAGSPSYPAGWSPSWMSWRSRASSPAAGTPGIGEPTRST
jgi:hypothetical protein